MKNSPLVSICMSVYNAEHYLQRCINSVLAQTYNNYEFLIVDDGSTDASVEVIKSYKDKRITLMRNSHNYIDSLNLLLINARGKYIARMDADDFMMPNRIEMQVEYMESHKDIGLVGMCAVIEGTEKMICSYDSVHIVSNQELLQGNPLIHSTTFFRVQVVKEYKLNYKERFKYAEDYRLWCEFAMSNITMAILPYVGIKYRLSSQQISAIHLKQMQQKARIVQKEFANWLCLKFNKCYKQPRITSSSNKLTVIIPFLNEGMEVVETVKSLRKAVANRIDIIVINDCSTDETNYISLLSDYNVIYVLNRERKGVAYSRDLGVSLSVTPYFLLLDAHMRVYNDFWLDDIISYLEKDDRLLLCLQTKQLWKNETGEIIELDLPLVYGAYLTMHKNQLSPGINWNYIEDTNNKEVQPIACVLGAGYAASKKYWMYLDGLKGLKQYGCDEVYMSFKVWAEGGKCYLLKKHSFGHIYRNGGPYQISQSSYVYNYLLLSYVLFPISTRCWSLSCCKLTAQKEYKDAYALFLRNKRKIDIIRRQFECICTVPINKVLRMNMLMEYYNECKRQDRIALADMIFDKLNFISIDNYGIIDGEMAVLIWLSLYNKKKRIKKAEEQCAKLFLSVKNAVLSQKVPCNFYYGACGIGWGLIYLYSNGLLDGIDESILCQIDRYVESLNINHIYDQSLYFGLGGIILYVVNRILYCRAVNTNVLFSNRFLSKLRLIELEIKKKNIEHPVMYYILLHDNINELHLNVNFNPRLNDWVTSPVTNPTDSRYWSYKLDKGCLAFTGIALEIETLSV